MDGCMDCKFFDNGYCRRHAPVWDNGDCGFPVVRKDDWCGDFADKTGWSDNVVQIAPVSGWFEKFEDEDGAFKDRVVALALWDNGKITTICSCDVGDGFGGLICEQPDNSKGLVHQDDTCGEGGLR